MGAFDSYNAEARCPRCGDIHAVDGQTKFFVPDFFGLFHRWFRPWQPEPLDFAISELQTERVWDRSWWRVREPGPPDRLDLLADFDDMFGCDCGLMFAVVLRFRLTDGAPPTATLMAVDLRDAMSEAALAVDFADGEQMLWRGDHQGFDEAMAALAGEPEELRMERLREALRGRFPADEVGAEEPGVWTHVHDEVRCEACGVVRRREELLLLTHPDYPESLFGAGWTGGRMARGTRVVGDLAWLAEDLDRGYYTRLRHPVPQDRLVILGRRRRTSCGCGAGRGALVLTFTREPGALMLADAAVRVVRGAEDLRDVDFAEAPGFTRDVSARTVPRPATWRWTREEAIRGVLAELAK